MAGHSIERSSFFPKPARGLFAAAAIALGLTAAPANAAESREALGPGDTVRVTVFQNPDLTTEAAISERGTIMFPLIGEVSLKGATPTGAANRIAGQLRKGKFMKNPQVNVTVLNVRSRVVSVLGQVAKPGVYPLDGSASRLTDILALAGGITPAGDDKVVVTRAGKIEKVTVDLAKMYGSGDLSSNIQIRHGDTIFVQRAPVFYVYGEVQRAGAYRMEPDMAVMQAISLGGGLTPRGTERGLTIHRKKSDGTVEIIPARLTDRIRPEDVIWVKESWF